MRCRRSQMKRRGQTHGYSSMLTAIPRRLVASGILGSVLVGNTSSSSSATAIIFNNSTVSFTGSVAHITVSASGGGTPGGTNGQVQFNNTGSFGGFTVSGDATLSTAGVLTIASLAVTNAKMAAGAASANIGTLTG